MTNTSTSRQIIVRMIAICFLLLTAQPAVLAQANLSSSSDIIANRAFMYDLANLYAQQRNGTIDQTIAETRPSIAAVAEGTVDVAAVSRNILSGDSLERQVTAVPVAWDALAIIVHPDNPMTNIRIEQLYDIYTGNLTDWQELIGNETPIEIVTHREEAAGADHNLAEILFGNTTQQLTSTKQADNSDELISEIEQNPMAIAVMNYSSVRSRQIKIVALNQVLISPTSVLSGDYLLYSPMYLMTRESGRSARDVRRLIRFVASSSAKNIMRRNGVLPYSDNLSLASRALDRARTMQQIRTRNQNSTTE